MIVVQVSGSGLKKSSGTRRRTFSNLLILTELFIAASGLFNGRKRNLHAKSEFYLNSGSFEEVLLPGKACPCGKILDSLRLQLQFIGNR